MLIIILLEAWSSLNNGRGKSSGRCTCKVGVLRQNIQIDVEQLPGKCCCRKRVIELTLLFPSTLYRVFILFLLLALHHGPSGLTWICYPSQQPRPIWIWYVGIKDKAVEKLSWDSILDLTDLKMCFWYIPFVIWPMRECNYVFVIIL